MTDSGAVGQATSDALAGEKESGSHWHPGVGRKHATASAPPPNPTTTPTVLIALPGPFVQPPIHPYPDARCRTVSGSQPEFLHRHRRPERLSTGRTILVAGKIWADWKKAAGTGQSVPNRGRIGYQKSCKNTPKSVNYATHFLTNISAGQTVFGPISAHFWAIFAPQKVKILHNPKIARGVRA